MNRKQRRGARARPSPSPKVSRTSALVAEAIRLFQSGEIAQAESLCRDILSADRDQAQALHILGLAALHAGHAAQAADHLLRALASGPATPELHYNCGVALEALGRLDQACERYSAAIALNPAFGAASLNLGNIRTAQGHLVAAEAAYRTCLAIDPRSALAMHNLANVLARTGRFREAVLHYRTALTLMPSHAPTHNNLAIALMEQGQLSAALQAHQRAASLAPDLVEAHVGVGNVLAREGRFADAVEHYLHALTLAPDDPMILNNLAMAQMQGGDLDRAEVALRRALDLAPDHADALANLATVDVIRGRLDSPAGSLAAHPQSFAARGMAFVRAARWHLLQGGATAALVAVAAAVDVEGAMEAARALVCHVVTVANLLIDAPWSEDLVVRAVKEGWGRPAELAPMIAASVKLRVAAHTQSDDVAPLAENRILLALLKACPIPDPDLETALMRVRGRLVAQVLDDTIGLEPGRLRLLCAIARQCFINEYAWDISRDETLIVARLQDRVTDALLHDLDDGASPFLESAIAALAGFMPLHGLACAQRLAALRWSQPVANLIAQQVHEPAQDLVLRDAVVRLTPIDDEVSLAVQGQYEDHPYPRWTVSAAAPSKPAALDDYLGSRLPGAPYRPMGRHDVDVLIAGCGTGQQAIDAANHIAHAKLLAVDLSRTSLAYAIRKTSEAKVTGIEYGQADILYLDELGTRFDLIESIGVLHHLSDPFAGWQRLLSLLKPGGVMNIGLYSERGRADLSAARTLIATEGFAPTLEGIRAFRRAAMARAADDPLFAYVTSSLDFYSVSGCRDLLFHVQEHRHTLPQIAEFLAAQNLTFLGFDAPASVREAYRQRFHDDHAMTDLATWDKFERDHPRAFAGMYQFWVQKAEFTCSE